MSLTCLLEAVLIMGPLADFARHQSRRGLAPETVSSRTRLLAAFSQWLQRDLLTATHHDIEAYLDSRRIGPRSRARLVSDLNCFYTYCAAEGLVATNPVTRVARPRLRRLLPHPVGEDDLAAAVALAPPKAKAMLLCAATAGMRCCEISRLDRADILEARQPPLIVAHGKGAKDRLVPMHPELWRALREHGVSSPGPVFTNAYGGRMSPALVSQYINGYLHELGLGDTAHSLRHRFATMYYSETKDLRATQELLGHESITSTAIYTAWSAGDAPAVIFTKLGVTPADGPRLPSPLTVQDRGPFQLDDEGVVTGDTG